MDAIYVHATVRAGLKRNCVSLVDFVMHDSYAEGDVRERHGGGCAGDPGTAPKITALRVMRADKKVLAYDVVNDKYVPVEAYNGP